MSAQTLGLLATVVDFMGSLLIAGSALRTLLRFVGRAAVPAVAHKLRVELAAALVTALSFKSGAGIIRTLTVGSWTQFWFVLSIIGLRFFLEQALKRLYNPPGKKAPR